MNSKTNKFEAITENDFPGSVSNTYGGNLVSHNSYGAKTLSSIAHIPRHKRARLVQESKPMLGASRKCKEIWQAIRKADFRNEGVLNEANIKLVFERCKDSIYELLKLTTPREMIDVFDRGQDGLLNEDE